VHFEINDGQDLASCQKALDATRQFNQGDDEMSAQFEADERARWSREDLLEKDLRADLHVKQGQLDQLVQELAELKAVVEKLATSA
jgi:hypothetical protein